MFTNALLTLPAKMRGMGAIRRGAFDKDEQKEFLGKIMYAKVRPAAEVRHQASQLMEFWGYF